MRYFDSKLIETEPPPMTDPVLLLKALADPTRLRLVRTLLEAPRYVEELAAALAL